jgi:hypothetical protein
MGYSTHASILALLLTGLLFAGCVDAVATDTDAGGSGSGGTEGDGGGDGDGSGLGGVCAADADCLAVGVTSDPCYSAGCSLPVAASTADAKADPCLVPWSGDSGPDVPADCRSNEPTPCTLACAVPPTCIDARCEAGMCMLSITQDGTDCKRDGDAP